MREAERRAPARLRELLGPQGALRRELPRWEPREAQIRMAEAVERVLAEDGVLLCEAGTGTGKTLAYLLPAVLSGRRVVISTATRALQDQIVEQDLPLVARVLGKPVAAAVLKGLSNYLCRRRFAEARLAPGSVERHRRLEQLERWAATSPRGDASELTDLPEDDPLWSEIASGAETRIGPRCEHHDACFVTAARRAAEAAELVVVNHHLYFADLALRGPHPAHLLPPHDAVIFDEAHQLEDTATLFFGVRLSSVQVERLVAEVRRLVGDATPGSPAERAAERTRRSGEALFAALGSGSSTRRVLEPDAFRGGLRERWFEHDAALEALSGALTELAEGLGGRREAALLVARRAEEQREALTRVVEGAPGRVTWCEATASGVSLSSTPVEIGPLLRARLFAATPAVVLTSATLALERRRAPGEAPGASAFAYLRSRLGVPEEPAPEELVLESPFDFGRRALLYLPRDLPAPTAPDFLVQAACRVAELIGVTRGGAFVLTTSLRSMTALHRELGALLPGVPLLLQGEAPKAALVARFRQAGDAVLVATQSFWEGVDVPGRALRLVVLEKVPFPVPTDPILQARSLLLEAEGRRAFTELHLPQAALALKQGFGRLIRSRKDAGIVALLDERVHRQGYGRRLLDALPPARRATRLEEVREFWSALEAETPGGTP